jgi:hypothetical protein
MMLRPSTRVTTPSRVTAASNSSSVHSSAMIGPGLARPAIMQQVGQWQQMCSQSHTVQRWITTVPVHSSARVGQACGHITGWAAAADARSVPYSTAVNNGVSPWLGNDRPRAGNACRHSNVEGNQTCSTSMNAAQLWSLRLLIGP